MAKGFKHGAGGASMLNFKVVGGTEQPENPKENTIWVNTETDISGWVLSQEEPVEPSDGLVWIGLGTASPAPFNALKKGGLYCFPASCRQYAGGAWVNEDAYLWKDGAWVQFGHIIEYLYNQGDTCDAVTGGWQARALGISSSSDALAPTVEVNESTIKLTANYDYKGYSSGVYEIINDVNVSSFDSISIAISSVAYLNRGAFFLVVFDRSISSWGSADCANAKASTQITDAGTFSLDISSISGECAIGIMTRNNSSATGPSMEFSEVVLR